MIDARIVNSDHMAEEEREDLADFRQHADLQARRNRYTQPAAVDVVKGASGEAKSCERQRYQAMLGLCST